MNRFASLVLLALVLSLAGCTGGGETVVSGFGNSGNFFGVDAREKRLALQLAVSGQVDEVTDEDLALIYETIRGKALEGDLDAALVLYHLAAFQRAAEE